MKICNFNIIISLAFILLSFCNISCKDDAIINNTSDQLFRPALFRGSVNSNTVYFSWVPIAGASYLLEVSRDSLLFQNDLKIIPLNGVKEYPVTDLWSNSRYSARIKAVSIDSAIKDSEYNQIAFVTGTENIFYQVADTGINQVLLKWDKSKDVSKIVVSKGASVVKNITLTTSEISAGEKLVEGLSEATKYDFKIYLGDMLRGAISVSTKS
jgi:hypothetical protein